MPDPIVTTAAAAVFIKAGTLTTALPTVQIRANETCIVEVDWHKIAAACKGEKALLAAMAVTDTRPADADLVAKELACPKCGERRVKALDMDKYPPLIVCLTCGLSYEVKPTSKRPATR